MKKVKFDDLKGRTFTSIEVKQRDKGENDETIVFVMEGGGRYILKHISECCEWVYIEDIAGDLDDLIGSPILLAEEVSSSESFDKEVESKLDDYFTWTWYKLATIKGAVTIRWFGSSNGCYSETADCFFCPPEGRE